MPFDYTDAPSLLIPDGTVATVSIHIRPGGVGEDDMLKRSANGECEMLELEFTVLDGTYKGRKFWHSLLLVGTNDNQKRMAASNLGVLKAILDSALGLMPNDVSAEARTARTVSVKAFQGMNFIARRGEGRGQEGWRELCGQEHPGRRHHEGQVRLAPSRTAAPVQRWR